MGTEQVTYITVKGKVYYELEKGRKGFLKYTVWFYRDGEIMRESFDFHTPAIEWMKAHWNETPPDLYKIQDVDWLRKNFQGDHEIKKRELF